MNCWFAQVILCDSSATAVASTLCSLLHVSLHLLQPFAIFSFFSFSLHPFLSQLLSSPELPPSLLSQCERLEVIVGLATGAHSWNSSGVGRLLGPVTKILQRKRGIRTPGEEEGSGMEGGWREEEGRGDKQSDLDDNRLPDEL